MLRRNLGDSLRRKGCDDSFLRYKMLQRNPSGVLHRKLPWTLHFSAFLVQIPCGDYNGDRKMDDLKLLYIAYIADVLLGGHMEKDKLTTLSQLRNICSVSSESL
ncbi:protein TIC110, chloroplastic [Tanacetum coccineum]|uniref:Protein TIC110, chloroplastic n=1 Tax=Tanacetum coccineum TaxID=301880 RepID=A0ABQ5ERV2_9ASTR